MAHLGSLPDGTVTFLFTDIEGSTRLLQQLGDRYADLLAAQRRLLRTVFQAHGGHELGTEGDSFFVAFSGAADALGAAVSGQRALAEHPWPEGAPVRVRMGLHTGEPTLTPEGYVGLDVHRAARISACGHGGQPLLSQRTRDLVGSELPADVSLRDMGAHRLKDLLDPEHLFQVVIDGLPADFPPLNSLSAYPNNLPLQLTRFIGREQELAEAKRLLDATRLLTLTGTGGAGKTRLALQVAADRVEAYGDGVWLVELAALTEPSLVAQAVASALHLREAGGAEGAFWGPGPGRRTVTDTLADYLQRRQLLLLLDNCEHLIDACAQLVERLLRICPHVKVLATSREALGIAGEQTRRVPSLAVPDPARLPAREAERMAAVTAYEAVQLFTDRVRQSQAEFRVTAGNAAAVAEVCHRLDGIPLAIELAAARVKALPVEQIAQRLGDRFRLLTGGSRTALPRQQTLRALIDWSYDLLSEPERVLLRHVSVFAGGWTLEAAEAICSDFGFWILDFGLGRQSQGHSAVEPPIPPAIQNPNAQRAPEIQNNDVLDLLTALVEKSLVQYEEEKGRYRLLETVQEYAREKLRQAGEEQLLRERHREWFLRLAERAELELMGPAQQEWLDRLEREHDNLRAALEWCLKTVDRGPCEIGLRLGGALWRFWWVHGHLTEGRERLAQLLSRAGKSARTPAYAKVLLGAGVLAHEQGDYGLARACYEESLAIRRQREDPGEASDPAGIAELLNLLGTLARAEGDRASAQQLFEESLSLVSERHAALRGKVLHNLALLASERRDVDEEWRLNEEALRYRRLAGDTRGEAETVGNLGALAHRQENRADARRLYQESLTLRRRLGDCHGIAVMLNNLAELAEVEGDLETAAALFVHSERLFRELGSVHASIPTAALQHLADSLDPDRWIELRAVAEGTRLEEIVGEDDR